MTQPHVSSDAEAWLSASTASSPWSWDPCDYISSTLAERLRSGETGEGSQGFVARVLDAKGIHVTLLSSASMGSQAPDGCMG